MLRLGRQMTRVTRVHQFFLIVAPEHRVIGAPPPARWLDDYFEWLGHPYYLGLQSAAETYGSAPQALQVTQVVTDTPRWQVQVGRVRIQFFVKRGVGRTPTQALANPYAPLRVSTPAATAFDLIRYSGRLGGIERAAETLAPLIPLIRVSDLKVVLNGWLAPRQGIVQQPSWEEFRFRIRALSRALGRFLAELMDLAD